MKILHVCAGWEKWNGAANIARMIMDEQRREGHGVSFATWAKVRDLRSADEVWIHCGWLPCLWWANLWARKAVRMPEACYDPVRLQFSAWKKRLVAPVERWALRRCERIVATCEAEKGWIEAYVGKKCPKVEVTDVKRFFDFSRKERKGRVEERGNFISRVERVDCVEGERFEARVSGSELKRDENNSKLTTYNSQLNLLYLGRRHPLKGVEYLEKAVAQLNNDPVNSVNPVQNTSTGSTSSTQLNDSDKTSTRSTRSTRLKIDLRIVSDAFGEEKERVWEWCDVLVLPTLSENFGLVVAEALERGKRVITTDGAPVWGEERSGGVVNRVERVERVEGEGSLEFRVEDGECLAAKDAECAKGDVNRVERVDRVERDGSLELEKGEIWCGYGGRLLYLKGYRDGTREMRVELLKKGIMKFGV